MTIARAIAIVPFSFVLATACGSSLNQDEYGEAGVVAAIAITAAIIQAARDEAPPVSRPSECCAICDKCSFPCGDVCVPIGNVCVARAGCACYDIQLPSENRPPMRDTPCSPPGQLNDQDAVVAPLIVVP